MNRLKGSIPKLAILLAGSGVAGTALAGGQISVGTVTLVPGASGIPALGGGALVALSLLLAVIAARVLRSDRNRAVHMTVALAAVLSLASAAGGVHLIAGALAVAGGVVTNPKGGSVNVFEGFNRVGNDSGVIQRPDGINLNSGCSQVFGDPGDKDSVGDCSVSPSSEIPDGRSCTLSVDCGNLANGGANGGGQDI